MAKAALNCLLGRVRGCLTGGVGSPSPSEQPCAVPVEHGDGLVLQRRGRGRSRFGGKRVAAGEGDRLCIARSLVVLFRESGGWGQGADPLIPLPDGVVGRAAVQEPPGHDEAPHRGVVPLQGPRRTAAGRRRARALLLCAAWSVLIAASSSWMTSSLMHWSGSPFGGIVLVAFLVGGRVFFFNVS